MFVSKTEITQEELNAEALEAVTIIGNTDDGTTKERMKNAICDGVLHWPEGWLFNIREATPVERQIAAMEKRQDESDMAMFELADLLGGGM